MKTPGDTHPTLAEVAAAARVSLSTASRALRADSPVSEVTRRRVQSAARRLGYEPNQLARSLRTRTSFFAGVIVPDIGVGFYARVLKGAQDALERAGYQVIVMNTDREPAREAAQTSASQPATAASSVAILLISMISPTFLPFLGAMCVFLLGMGVVSPLATARALSPFGEKAGAASALLGFWQMMNAAIGVWLAATGSHEAMLALGVVLSAFSLLALGLYARIPRS